MIVSVLIITSFAVSNYLALNLKLENSSNLSEILNNLNESGITILRNLLKTKGATLTQSTIQNNSKLYLDFNGDGIIDSLIIFTFINKSSTEIEFVIVSYILKIQERNKTNHILRDHPLSVGSYRKFKILSNNEVLDLNYCSHVKFIIADTKIKEIKRIEISTTQ